MDYSLETADLLLTWSLSNDVLGSVISTWILSFWIIFWLFYFAIIVFMIVSRWRVFEKAWLPGWGILLPIYNIYLMFKLGWRPGGWTRWILFPPVLAILMLILNFDIANKFKKHRAFGLWLWFLPIVFIPILAFDKKSKWSKK